MPQRLPLVLALGTLSLLAGALPGYASVTPVRRPPAVPALPQAQPAQADPVAATAQPQNATAPAPVDTAAQKRDAQDQTRADIVLTALAQPLDLAPRPTYEFSLGEPEPEIVKPLAEIALNPEGPVALPITVSLTALPDQPKDDLAAHLPDVDLNSISQSADLGYHASIAPFTLNPPSPTSPPEEVAALALPDIAAELTPDVSLYSNAPLSLYIGPVNEIVADLAATDVVEKDSGITPRRRPRNLVASNEPAKPAPERLDGQAEPAFQLRR